MRRFTPLFILILILAGNCTKKATAPISTITPILFVTTSGYPPSKIYFIDTGKDSLVDSMIIPYPYESTVFGVSPDGAKLYLTNGVLDTKSKSIINGALTGVPTPDGRFLIYAREYPGAFQIISTKTNEIVYSDSTIGMIIFGTGNIFDSRKGLVYGMIVDKDKNTFTKIGVFDYRIHRLIKVINPVEIGGLDVPILDIVVTHDGGKLYYTSRTSPGFFTGIDLRIEKVTTVSKINSISFLGHTSDGYIYLTDTGICSTGWCPTGTIAVYSPFSEDFLAPIDLRSINENLCDSSSFEGRSYYIAISNYGEKAYVSTTFDDCIIIVIDTRKNTIKKTINVGNYYVQGLAIQRS